MKILILGNGFNLDLGLETRNLCRPYRAENDGVSYTDRVDTPSYIITPLWGLMINSLR